MSAVESGAVRRSKLSKSLLLAGIGLVILGLVALGNWQLRRLDAKLELIERVESRAFAAPVAAPDRSNWPAVRRDTHEYLHLRVRGRFLHDRETLVRAVTERGGGYWVLTPLASAGGAIYLVNRGFVPTAAANPELRRAGLIEGEVEVSGLLRISEPGGIWLRANDAALERWYSRDVAAIARARNLDEVAPFFIDADAGDVPGGLPQGGMTRLQFRNVHLFYALTWYGLALTLAALTVRVIWLELNSGGGRRSGP